MNWSPCLDNGVPTVNCVPIAFNNVILAALIFVGVIALIFIILSGVKFITSGGDPKKVQAAKHTMTFAIIGLTIVLLSFAILLFIGYITGTTNCINSATSVNNFLNGC